MPNTGTITGLTAATSYVLDAVHVDAWGNVSAVVSSAAFETDAAPSTTTAHVTTALGDTAVEAFSTTVDASGYSAGQKLIIAYNGLNHPTSVTVNGNSAGAQLITVTGGTGRKVGLYEYTLVAADISAGTITVEAIPPSLSLGHILDIWHASSGSVASRIGGDNVNSLTVTPTQSSNAVIAGHYGGDEFALSASGFAYTAGGLSRSHFTTSTFKGATAGSVQNAATSGLTITWTDDGPDNYASIAFVVE